MNKKYNPGFRRLPSSGWLIVSIFLFYLGLLPAAAQFKTTAPLETVVIDTCYASGHNHASHLHNQFGFLHLIGQHGGAMSQSERTLFTSSMRSAVFTISTTGAPSGEALEALQYAADIWSTEVQSSIPINVAVSFEPIQGNVFGRVILPKNTIPAGPNPDLLYNRALGDAIVGFDQHPGEPDFTIIFNSQTDFYFGTDGQTPRDQLDFVTIALHEIGHGMGMTGAVNQAGTQVGNSGGTIVQPYDLFVELGSGRPITSLPFGSPEQAAALTSDDLFMNAPTAVNILGERPKIYAPEIFDRTSSYAHWDNRAFPNGDPNSLMTPFIDNGEVIHDIGDIFRGLLKDIGWSRPGSQAAFDIAAVSIDAPSTGKDLTAREQVTITLANLGTTPARNFTVAYQFEGQVFSEVFRGTIGPGQVVPFTFRETTVDLSVEGREFVIQAGVFANDERPANDFTGAFITHLKVVDDFPYFEDFEIGSNGWNAGEASSWELGTPQNSLIGQAASGSQAWVTNLTGNYGDEEASLLTSPCFDFSSAIVDPVLFFALHTEIEFGFDGLAVQMSIDDGKTWENVGELGDPDWYDANLNAFGSNALEFSEGNGDAFTGSTGGYRIVSHPLDGSAGQPSVLIRFAFGSDINTNDEGAAIDNIFIGIPEVNGVIEDIQLASGVDLTENETVAVLVANKGSETIDEFELSLIVNDEMVLRESFSGPLAAGEQKELAFAGKIDLSVPGSYSVEAVLNLEGEQVPADNTLSKTIANFKSADNNFPYQQSFEETAGGWFPLGTNSSWELGTPQGNVIAGASEGEIAWATNLDGFHNTAEQSYVISPVFDFSALQQPSIILDIFYDLGAFDGFPLNGVTLQYSKDLGASWANVGEVGDTDNWYNVNINNNPFGATALDFTTGNGDAWGLNSQEYVTAAHDLAELAGEKQLQFRLALGTIAFDLINAEGFAFDNIRIGDPPRIECAPLAPSSNEEGTCSAQVTVPRPSVPEGGNFRITNNFNGTDDASGSYPVGTTEVVWEVEDLSTGLRSSCTVSVVVLDQELPTIVAEEVEVYVAKGIESKVVEYQLPTISDNCPFTTSITHSVNLGLPFDPFSIVCDSRSTSFIRLFDPQREFSLVDEFVVTKGTFGVSFATDPSGSQEVTLNIYFLEADAEVRQRNFKLLASEQVTIPNITTTSEQRLFEVPIDAIIPKGTVAVMEVVTSELGDNVGGRDFRLASNSDGQRAPSYLIAGACGVPEVTPISDIGFPQISHVMGLASDVTRPLFLVEGLGSGAEFPIGTTDEIYAVVDGAENVAFATVSVTVKENPFEVLLVESPSGEKIQRLSNGDVVDIMDPRTQSVSIVADLEDFEEEVGSVVFELNGSIQKIENFAPYAIAGDSKDRIKRFRVPVGQNVLTVTTFAKRQGRGMELASRTITFEAINGSSVSQFLLVDAENDVPIRPLGQKAVIDLAATPNVTIEAITNPPQVGSVLFELNDQELRTENFVPYALNGDRAGDYRSFDFSSGEQTLRATPYELKRGQGSTGEALTLNFEVKYGSTVEGVNIVNTQTNQVVDVLKDGATIDLARPGMAEISLVALTGPAQVGSVEFVLDGERLKTENFAPYAIAGKRNQGAILRPFLFEAGPHTLLVRTFSKRGTKGIEGGSISIDFNVTYGAKIEEVNIVNTDSKQVVQPVDGSTIDLHDPVFKRITMLAETTPDEVGSVAFLLNGRLIKTENQRPYAIAGDRNGGERLNRKRFEVGNYELQIVPYSRKGRKGLKGEPLTVNFEVVSGEDQKREQQPSSEDQPLATDDELEADNKLTAYPVPFTNSLTFSLHSNANEQLTVTLMDLWGRVLIAKSFQTMEGPNRIKLDLEHLYLPTGTYLVGVSGEVFGYKVVRVSRE